jgi:hypothetical protein
MNNKEDVMFRPQFRFKRALILTIMAATLFATMAQAQFTDRALTLGVDDGGNGVGVAWGDYNNDGLLDLYVAKEGAKTLN